MGKCVVEMDTKALQKAVDAGLKLGVRAAGALKQTMADTVLSVERRAVERAPIKEGHLRRGIRGKVNAAGPMGLVGIVTAGGLASAYAEVQHEREDFAHTLSEWAEKSGYMMASSLKSGKSFVVGKRKAKRKTPKGYKGGQHHFLYGRSNSAWNKGMQARHKGKINATLKRIAEGAFE